MGRRIWFSPSGLTRMKASSLVMSPSLLHVDGDLELGEGGPLAGPRLEHPELASLDGELYVLHVAVILLEDAP